MLKEFIDNKMSQDEVDSMMDDFFKKKEEKEFRKKWNKILDNKKPDYKIIRFFRNNLYAAVSAASIILLIGFGGIYYGSKYINNDVQYTDVIKGNAAIKTELNNLTNKQVVSIGSGVSERTKSIFELYKVDQFEKVINELEIDINANSYISNEVLWMAGLSAIKIENYSKAKSFLLKMNTDSPNFSNSKELLKIIEDLLN